MYPAVTVFPLVLCEFEIIASSLWRLNISFMAGNFLHRLGGMAKPKRIPNII
jgi:hypothetical protein